MARRAAEQIWEADVVRKLPILFIVIKVTGEIKAVWKEGFLVIFLDK